MRRTTISLPDEVSAGLEREARRRRVAVSQVAREAIQAHLGLPTGGRRALRFAALGRSGHRDTAEHIDDVLATEWDE